MALAAIFGRAETDAFFVAFTIPNALRQLLGEGAVASAVVPVLSGKLATDGDDAARDFFAKIRGVSLVALTVVTALGVAFAGPLCELFASGYHARTGEFQRTVTLTRLVFPYIFFMGTAALGMAALNAKRKFAVAAFAPGLLNVSFLACAFLLPGPLERAGVDRAWAMGAGALVGGALQVAAQIPALRAIGYASRPRFALDPAVKDALRRLLPMTFGIGVYYVDLVLSRRFLSELPAGSQSYFLVGDAPLRLSAGHLRHGALDRGAPVALDLRREGRHGRAAEDLRPRNAPRDVRRDPVQHRPRGARRAHRARALRARTLRRDGLARDGALAPLAGRRDLDRRGRSPARAGLLRARRHEDAGRRERDRSLRVHRARVDPPRAHGSGRNQRGGRRLERRPDGLALRPPPRAARPARGRRHLALRASDDARVGARRRQRLFGGASLRHPLARAAGRRRARDVRRDFRRGRVGGPLARARRDSRRRCAGGSRGGESRTHEEHAAAESSRRPIPRKRHRARPAPRSRAPGVRVRRPLERRQIEPFERARRPQGPRADEQGAGPHREDQPLRGAHRGGHDGLRRFARLRLRGALQVADPVVGTDD